jgi:hypothetical protein
MPGAMERVLTVNASRDSKNPGGEFGIGSIGETGDYTDDFGIKTVSAPGAPSGGADQGPCLYLGPRGQRCGRRATAGGFCASTSLAQQWAELQSLRKNWPPLFSQSSQSYGPISRTS